MYAILLSLVASLLSSVDACRLDSIPRETGFECLYGADTLAIYSLDQGETAYGYDLVQDSQTVQGSIRWDIYGTVTLEPTDSMSATVWRADLGLPACDLESIRLADTSILRVCTIGETDTMQLDRDAHGVLYTMTRTDARGFRILEMGALVVGADGKNVYDVSDWCDRGTWRFGPTDHKQTALPSLPVVQLAARNVPTEPERETTCYSDLSCPR